MAAAGAGWTADRRGFPPMARRTAVARVDRAQRDAYNERLRYSKRDWAMQIPALVDRFVRWCAEHRAANTVRLYKGRLTSFAVMFADRELSQLNPLDVEDWLHQADRKADGSLMAPDTRRANRTSFKRLQSWAIDHRQLAQPIIAKLEMPRGRRRTRIPTTPEILQLLRLTEKTFRLIYIALLRSGCRPNEMCRATFAHITTTEDGTRMIVLAEHKTAKKTGKARRIPIGRKLGRVIARSVGDRTEGPLFLSPRGRQWTPSNLSRAFCTLKRKAQLPDDLVLYSARHHKGTNVCRKLGIKAAAEVLGHTQTSTTERYIHLTDGEIADYQDAA